MEVTVLLCLLFLCSLRASSLWTLRMWRWRAFMTTLLWSLTSLASASWVSGGGRCVCCPCVKVHVFVWLWFLFCVFIPIWISFFNYYILCLRTLRSDPPFDVPSHELLWKSSLPSVSLSQTLFLQLFSLPQNVIIFCQSFLSQTPKFCAFTFTQDFYQPIIHTSTDTFYLFQFNIYSNPQLTKNEI